MTKEELLAANERLGAEIAALRELLTVIGTAMPPRPANHSSARDQQEYHWLCRDRLSTMTSMASCAMDYAATDLFAPVVHGSAGSLRKVLGEPLPYRAKDATEMAEVPA